MCQLQPTTAAEANDVSFDKKHMSNYRRVVTTTENNDISYAKKKHGSNSNQIKQQSWLISKIWPLPVPVVLSALPFLLPQSSYLNRGYTVWFHLLSVVYLLTQSTFIRKVLILQGIGICLGWYSAIATDLFVEGTFCHTLYRNMPGSMRPYMIQYLEPGEDGGESTTATYIILNTYSSWLMKALSHVLDAIGHPGLVYLFYRLHYKQHYKNVEGQEATSFWKDVLTWPIIVSAWHFSRIWSMVHSFYNTGNISWWYFGHDVYKLNNLNCYLVAYIAEGICFVVAILCRLYWDYNFDVSIVSSLPMKDEIHIENLISMDKRDFVFDTPRDRAPQLIYSESAVSTTSLMWFVQRAMW